MASAVIGSLRVNLGVDTAAFSDGLKSAQSRLASFGAAMKTGLVAAGVAATAALSGIGYAVKGSIDAADEMSKAAAKIGIPTEELSRLKYAADLSGVSFEGLQTGVRKVSSLMADSAAGISSASEAMARYGLSATNADGSLKSASQIMGEVADKMAAMPDGAMKTAMAIDLFGKAGADMIPLLNGGSAALGQLMAEADQFGQVFTEGMGKDAEAFNDNISRLQGAFGALAADIASRMLPYLASFTDWLVANTPNIAAIVQGIVDFGISVGELVGKIVSFGQASVQAFVDFHGRLQAIGASVRQFAADFVSVFQAIPGMMAEVGRNIIDGLWNGISGAWDGVKSKVSGIAGSLVDGIKSKLGIHSPSLVMQKEVGEPIVQGIVKGIGDSEGSVDSAAQSIGQTIGSAFEGIITGSMSAQDAIKQLLGSFAQLAANAIFKGMFGENLGSIGDLVGGLFGFANGGSFQVGGSGGIDSQLVAFKASPNETVSVTKPGQTDGMSGGSTHVTFGVDVDGNGNLIPIIRDVSRDEARKATANVEQRAVNAVKDARTKRFLK